MRLRTTLVAVLVLVALLLSGTVYAGFATHKSDIVDREQRDAERSAEVVATRIDTRLAATFETMALWSTNVNVSGDTGDQLVALNTFVNRTAFDGAGIYATDGTLLAVSGPTLTAADIDFLVGTNYAGDPFFERALDGDTYVSRPEETLTDRDVVRLATPIRDRDGRIVGVFSGQFDLEAASLFRDVTVENADRITIHADGRELFANQSVEGETITAEATVDRTGWTVTAERSRSALTRQLRVVTTLQIGGILVGLLTVALVGLWISRTTVARIETLLEALADLEAGESRTDLDLGSIAEWRQIADRFNALSRTLRQRDSQLRVLNRVLRHNLRNDMNVITARAERVLAEEKLSPAIAADVERIHETATRLIDTGEHARTLYDDLLASPTRAIEPVDVVPVVDRQIETLATRYPESTIETDLPDHAWALDATVLPIVVEEILHNAIVHNDVAPADRQVTVTVESHADPVAEVETAEETRIVVADNGPGMPMVEEALLTETLEETPIEHGSGLGVWLVNWLLDQIGGAVSVSTGIERGTTVTIHLPAPENPPSSVSGDGQPSSGDLSPSEEPSSGDLSPSEEPSSGDLPPSEEPSSGEPDDGA